MPAKLDPSQETIKPQNSHHLFDGALTLDEYSDFLTECHEHLLWLRSLFAAIQADEDVEEGYQISNLAEIGEYLADAWMNQIGERREEFNTAYAEFYA